MRLGTAAGWALGLAAFLAGGGAARSDEGAPAAPAGGAKPPDKGAEEKRKDDRPVSSDEAAKAAIDRFERDFASRDEGRRMNAIVFLAQTKNDLVTKKLGALLSNPNLEVRQAAALTLDGQYQNPDLAGELLRKALLAEEESEVGKNIALALGRIGYVKAIPDMGEVMKKAGDVFLKIEILKSFGKMKDRSALLPILDLWLLEPHGYSWEGGEESVDTGTPGDADQKAAEAKYKAKHKNDRRGAPPPMLKTYVQTIAETVFKITGEKLSGPTELMRWMVQHESELPFKLPAKVKTTLKEWEDRAAKRKK